MTALRLPLHFHDAFGRKDGKGEPIGIGRGITGDEPDTGSCSRFSFAVSDDGGFCVAHCTNALVTMSSERSLATAQLFAAAPDLHKAVADFLALGKSGGDTSWHSESAQSIFYAMMLALDKAGPQQ